MLALCMYVQWYFYFIWFLEKFKEFLLTIGHIRTLFDFGKKRCDQKLWSKNNKFHRHCCVSLVGVWFSLELLELDYKHRKLNIFHFIECTTLLNTYWCIANKIKITLDSNDLKENIDLWYNVCRKASIASYRIRNIIIHRA